MFEVLTGLFDTAGFPPRKDCGTAWTPQLIWLHVTSDLFIWLAYLSIPLVLLYFTKRRDLPYPRLFVLFALFILACGTTHLVDALMFEYPIYRFAGLMKFLTAAVSWATVVALVPIVPRVMNAVTAAARPGEVTRQHQALPAAGRFDHGRSGPGRARAHIVAILAGVLAVLVRTALDPVLAEDQGFVVALLAVVYVSWQHGFGPGVLCLCVGTTGYAFFFIPPRYSSVVAGFGNQLALALFFFCGVACAALGEAQRAAQRRARVALSAVVARGEELESEIVRRRVVEAALRQRETDLVAAQRETAGALARLNAFLDNAPLGIAFFDPDLRYVRVNAYLAAANGKSVEAHTGRRLTEVLPDFPPEVAEAYRRTAGPDAAPFKTRFRRPDVRTPGATRVWQVTAFPVRDPGGGTVGAGVVAEDVTAKLKAEEELRESEARFRSMADGAPALIWLSETDGRRTYFNKMWVEFTGRPAEEQFGYAWADSIHPADRELYLGAYATAIAGRKGFELEYRLRRADGAERWVLARGTPRVTPSGEFAGFVGLCLDVTERREADERLRESEAFRRSVFENSPDCLLVLDLDGRILEANEAGCELMEVDDVEPLRGARWADLWPAANRETIREAVEGARGGRVGRLQGFCPTAKGT
ncbi:MAG: PAS domain-containing protein, partial [Planctomycetes bacterium]|nr:PAS domain-containing protein [Planctomycetota bacterium]